MTPRFRHLCPFLMRCVHAGTWGGAARWLGLSMAALGLLGACDDAPPKVVAETPASTAMAESVPVKAGPALIPVPVPAVPPVLPDAVSEAVRKKLAGPLLKALELSHEPQAAGQSAPTAMPGIPIQHGGRVLVDLEAEVSQNLLDEIAKVGGLTAPNPAPGRQLRVFIPLAGLEALAGRADVSAIAVATVSAAGGMQAAPGPPAAAVPPTVPGAAPPPAR